MLLPILCLGALKDNLGRLDTEPESDLKSGLAPEADSTSDVLDERIGGLNPLPAPGGRRLTPSCRLLEDTGVTALLLSPPLCPDALVVVVVLAAGETVARRQKAGIVVLDAAVVVLSPRSDKRGRFKLWICFNVGGDIFPLVFTSTSSSAAAFSDSLQRDMACSFLRRRS